MDEGKTAPSHHHPNHMIKENQLLLGGGVSETVREIQEIWAVGKILPPYQDVPYVSKIISCEIETAGEGKPVIYRVLLEPATVEEAEEYWQKHKIYDDPDEEDEGVLQERVARRVAATLRQKSWSDGVPKEAQIYCDAHQAMRPAHGANRYDSYLLCNACVEQAEIEMAREPSFVLSQWIGERAASSRIEQIIEKAEHHGSWQVVLKPDRRELTIIPLYQFVRHEFDPVPPQSHWPYPDMQPECYLCYLAPPPEQFEEKLTQTIYTSREKLHFFLAHGRLPKPGEINED